MRWFCSFKSYGDLVIACNSLRNADRTRNGLLVGSHLSPLLNIIEFKGTWCVLETGNTVPALFDMKKNGSVSAIRNGFMLRKKIQASVRQRDDVLVFDELGVRQRFLAWPKRVEAVAQGADNIYQDYARYLGLNEGGSVLAQQNDVTPSRKVYIFPDSRLQYKDLPDWLVVEIAKENRMCGKDTIVVKVGKRIDLPQFDSLQIEWIDGLDTLNALVLKADFMVSADSLPAHLAEYLGVPVFVFTPIPTGYWVPLSSFKNGYFSGFNSLSRYKEWLNLI